MQEAIESFGKMLSNIVDDGDGEQIEFSIVYFTGHGQSKVVKSKAGRLKAPLGLMLGVDFPKLPVDEKNKVDWKKIEETKGLMDKIKEARVSFKDLKKALPDPTDKDEFKAGAHLFLVDACAEMTVKASVSKVARAGLNAGPIKGLCTLHAAEHGNFALDEPTAKSVEGTALVAAGYKDEDLAKGGKYYGLSPFTIALVHNLPQDGTLGSLLSRTRRDCLLGWF